MFQYLHDVLRGASRVAVWVGGAALMLCAVLITGDVFLRKFFGISVGGSDEITAYVFAISTTWAFAYCLLHRANIRIDAVYNRLTPAFRAAIDTISIAMLMIFVAILTERAFYTLIESIANQSTSITPLGTRMWIPQAFWVAGWVFLLFTLGFVLLHVVTMCVRGDLHAVNRIAGLRSVEDEIGDEVRQPRTTPPHGAGNHPC